MLCLIGESFDGESVLVNGAVVNVRNRGDKISMWLCEAKPQESIIKIGQTLKKRLGIDEKVRFFQIDLMFIISLPGVAWIRVSQRYNKQDRINCEEQIHCLTGKQDKSRGFRIQSLD